MTRAIDRLTWRDREIIGEIAANIRTRGHYQGGGQILSDRRVCLVVNPAMRGVKFDPPYRRILDAITEAAEFIYDPKVGKEYSPDSPVPWNDAVSTDEVLDVLAALEVG